MVLTVRDSRGNTTTRTADIRPTLVTLRVDTDPSGLAVIIDGQPLTAPLTIAAVKGMIRSVGTTTPQTLAGATYAWAWWSDGGAITRNITMSANVTLLAGFAAPQP
jgi:hypothetical protein